MKNFSISLLSCLMFFAPFMAKAQVSKSDTLFLTVRQSIETTLKNNPDLQRVLLDESAVLLQIENAKASGLPQVKGKAGYTDNFALPQQILPGEIFGQEGDIAVAFGVRHSLTAGLELNQMLYNKTYFENIKKLGAVKRTYSLQTLVTKEDLVYNVVQAYIQFQTTARQQKIVADNLKRLRQLVSIADAQYKNGIIKRLEVDQLEVNQTNLETELASIEAGAEQQLNVMRYYLGVDMDTPLVLSEDLETTERFALSNQLLLSENLQYQLLQQQRELNLLETNVINAAYYPTLSAFMQYNYTGQGNQFNFKEGNYLDFSAGLWGLNLSVPIFDGFQRKRKIQENNIKSMQLSLDEQNLTRATRMEYSNANIKLIQNEKLITTQRINMELATNVYNATKLSYQEGVAALPELLNTENSLREAQTQYLSAILTFKQAELDHARASGQLAQLIKTF